MADSEKNKSSAEVTAAQWMARRDRGFTPAEQDEYLQWLSEDPTHGAELARLARAWDRLDALHQWNPTHSARPNADLLLPRHRRSWLRHPFLFAAAAAIVVLASLAWLRPGSTTTSAPEVIMHPGPRRLTLSDGSMIELNAAARVDVRFSAETRQVRLLEGEAHFIVAKNPARPFVVTAGDYSVRAVGTAFNVSLSADAVDVLVTEGQVQLGAPHAPPASAPALPRLIAGQQALIHGGTTTQVEVNELTPAQIEHRLDWQSLRLEFSSMPLRDVIEEFNRYNSRQLLVQDTATGNILIGGTFRADNVEAFVRLLDVGFGIKTHAQGENLVLSRP